MNMDVKILLWALTFNCLGYFSKSGIGGLYGDSIFNCVRNLPPDFIVMVSGLTFKLWIHFWLVFVSESDIRGRIQFYSVKCPIFPASCFEDTVFLPIQYSLTPFSMCQILVVMFWNQDVQGHQFWFFFLLKIGWLLGVFWDSIWILELFQNFFKKMPLGYW